MQRETSLGLSLSFIPPLSLSSLIFRVGGGLRLSLQVTHSSSPPQLSHIVRLSNKTQDSWRKAAHSVSKFSCGRGAFVYVCGAYRSLKPLKRYSFWQVVRWEYTSLIGFSSSLVQWLPCLWSLNVFSFPGLLVFTWGHLKLYLFGDEIQFYAGQACSYTAMQRECLQAVVGVWACCSVGLCICFVHGVNSVAAA